MNGSGGATCFQKHQFTPVFRLRKEPPVAPDMARIVMHHQAGRPAGATTNIQHPLCYKQDAPPGLVAIMVFCLWLTAYCLSLTAFPLIEIIRSGHHRNALKRVFQ